LWILGTGAQWRELPEKYPAFQTCHRRFQQWVRSGKLEMALRLLARHLHKRGKLDLREAFVDATFASAKKGALQSARPAVARGQRSSLSPLITVFLSLSVYKAPHPTRASLLKKCSPGVFSKNSQPDSSATKPTTQIRWTSDSEKNTVSN
jgi:hypothetical protein